MKKLEGKNKRLFAIMAIASCIGADNNNSDKERMDNIFFLKRLIAENKIPDDLKKNAVDCIKLLLSELENPKE